MSHLIAISIGPVQEFIASARRFRDLWFGSHLLAEVAAASAQALQNAGGRLIFPSPDTIATGGAANKLLAQLDGDPAVVAKAVHEAAAQRLLAFAREAFRSFEGLPEFNSAVAHRQITDLLEFHWAAVPETSDYAADRRRVEGLLAARKATRDFAAVDWGSSAPKSSLDGLREAVIDPSRLKGRTEASVFGRFGLRVGENLCGVGLLKRHGGDTLAVPSTAHMAALSVAQEADPARVGHAAEALIAALLAAGLPEAEVRRRTPGPLGLLNGQVLFSERLDRLLSDGGEAVDATAARRALWIFFKDTDARRPHPYYVILHADGDKMGEAIGRQPTPDAHRKLSRDLARFAAGAGAIVEKHDGFLVYAGGDDVLALLPLHQALSCARELALDFARQLASFAVADSRPTLSVGLAVGHQMDPAGDTLDRARRAEKKAKVSRDALGLVIKKRGGGEQVIAGRWGDFDKRFDEWIVLHRDDMLPDGAAYELRALASDLGKAAPPLAYKAETERILGRKRIRDEDLVAQAVQSRISSFATGADALTQLAEELVAARLFALPGDR